MYRTYPIYHICYIQEGESFFNGITAAQFAFDPAIRATMLGKLRSIVEEEKEVELYICCYSMPYDRYNTLYNITPTSTSNSTTNAHGHNNNKNNKRGRNGNTHTHTNTTQNNKTSKQRNEQRVVKQFALFDCLSIDDMKR